LVRVNRLFITKMPPIEDSIGTHVENLIKQNKVIIFSKTTCPYCDKVKELFKSLKTEYTTIELDRVDNGNEIKNYLISKTKQKNSAERFCQW